MVMGFILSLALIVVALVAIIVTLTANVHTAMGTALFDGIVHVRLELNGPKNVVLNGRDRHEEMKGYAYI